MQWNTVNLFPHWRNGCFGEVWPDDQCHSLHALNIWMRASFRLWADADDGGARDERTTYVALETYLGDGTWDCLRGETPKVTETP
jgi:hypothetical protein